MDSISPSDPVPVRGSAQGGTDRLGERSIVADRDQPPVAAIIEDFRRAVRTGRSGLAGSAVPDRLRHRPEPRSRFGFRALVDELVLSAVRALLAGVLLAGVLGPAEVHARTSAAKPDPWAQVVDTSADYDAVKAKALGL